MCCVNIARLYNIFFFRVSDVISCDASLLSTAVSVVSVSVTDYQCPACDLYLSSERSLQRHYGSKHQAKLNRCLICRENFIDREELDAHKEAEHQTIRGKLLNLGHSVGAPVFHTLH